MPNESMVDDTIRLNSELRMKTWVTEFTKQIVEIEEFYIEKFEEKIALFIDM